MTDRTEKPRLVFGEPVPWQLLAEAGPGVCSRCLHRLADRAARCAYCGLDTRTEQVRQDEAFFFRRRGR